MNNFIYTYDVNIANKLIKNGFKLIRKENTEDGLVYVFLNSKDLNTYIKQNGLKAYVYATNRLNF